MKSSPPTLTADDTRAAWRQLGFVLLSVRFVQGWIYWGGGSRRFIYAPSKLDPHAHSWMANKLQTAMPGALLGMGHVVDYLLRHFTLLYAGLIIVSAAELLFGLFLLLGFMTRLSALVSIGLSILLMMLFGWQGATCIDEWTMASANFGMGLALWLGGGGAISIDAWLLARHPQLANQRWFRWFGSGPWTAERLRQWSVLGAAATVLFVVSTYNYFRGSVLTPFHSGPVSPAAHHLRLSNGQVRADGQVRFTAYLDAGTPAAPANIIRADVLDTHARIVEQWDSAVLAALSPRAFFNDYAYNRFRPGYAGITAAVGARARITLPPARHGLNLSAADYALVLHSVNGHTFTLTLRE